MVSYSVKLSVLQEFEVVEHQNFVQLTINGLKPWDMQKSRYMWVLLVSLFGDNNTL